MENKKIIIDAKNGSFGRIASFAAKNALEGNEVVIVNSEKAIITGSKKNVIEKYSILRDKGGHSQKGPKVIRLPHRVLKRGIRGMLPDHRKGIGKQAFLKIKCYDGIPKEFKDGKMEKMESIKHDKFITLKELTEKI